MPRFNIAVEFDLSTTVEPDFYNSFDSGDTEDFNDSSYFSSGEVNVSGGSLEFTIEAEDESDAENRAEEVIAEGNEIEDRNGLTWMIDSVNITVEPVEEPMTKDRAKELIGLWLSEQTLPDDVKEAFRFLLAEV